MDYDTGREQGSRREDWNEEEEEKDEVIDTLGGEEEEEAQYGVFSSASPAPAAPAAAVVERELRLVLLGRSGSGKSAAGNCILGRQAFRINTAGGADGTCQCESRTATVAGRKITLVDTPDWFCSESSTEDVQDQIGSCQALVAPGPHAFLLCVPVDQPVSLELQGLEALEMVFGRGAVRRHTLVLFTHADRLPAGVHSFEEYVSDGEHQDLLKLVERCWDHYHVLERGSDGGGGGGRGGGEGEQEGKEKRSVEQLVEKVEQVVRESGVEYHAWPAAEEQEQETRSKGLRRDRGEEQEQQQQEQEASSTPTRRPDTLTLSSPIRLPERGEEPQDDPSLTPTPTPVTPPTPPPESESTEMAPPRDDADDITAGRGENKDEASGGVEPAGGSGPPKSFLRGLWDTVTGWISRVPGLVRGSALLGALVGFFVGGPVGSMLGVTVGSVATEVGRRKRVKNKTQ